MIDGYPSANLKTVDFIINSLAEKHADYKSEVMMQWVNKGFSRNDKIDDWRVKLAPYST